MNWIKLIENYQPYNEQEAKDQEYMKEAIHIFNNLLTRENKMAHITSSGFVVNKSRDKVLMVHHNIYSTWAWTGGHADGETDLLKVAIKEAVEETGVSTTAIATDIISLDILPVYGHIKKDEYISAHLHLNVAFLLEADEEAILKIKEDENSDVKWLPLDQLSNYSNEPYLIEIYNKIIERLKGK